MEFNFKDAIDENTQPDWLESNKNELEAIFMCTARWALENYKKKVSKKAIKRLQVLRNNIGSFYSLCLFSPSLLAMHAIELVHYALTCKTDKEFLENVSGFTTIEECGMLMTFFFDNDSILKKGVTIVNGCHDLARFINIVSNDEPEEANTIDMTGYVKNIVENLREPLRGMSDILLTADYEEYMQTLILTMRENIDGNIIFSGGSTSASIEDCTFTMAICIINILVSKLVSFPVLKDVSNVGETILDVFKCPKKITSQEEAENHVKTMQSTKTPLKNKIEDIIGRLAVGFTDNAVVSLLPVGVSSRGEHHILNKIYNDSGMIIEEHEHLPRQAEWSQFCVGFYNALANYYADKEWVHDDVTEAIEAGIKDKELEQNIIADIKDKTLMASYENIVTELQFSIVATIEKPVAGKPKKRRVPKKKI